MRFWKTFFRSCRLRCPRCGVGKLYDKPFRTAKNCSNCDLKFEREPGFFLGSIYFNYGLTALVVAVVYPILLFNEVASNDTLLLIAFVFVLIFPVIFFHHSRSLWAGFDQFMDPRNDEAESPEGEAADSDA